jgi:hypothetical protein
MSWKPVVISLGGAAVGGILGYQGFLFALKYNFYAMILPGGLIGLGASFGRCRWIALPILYAVVAFGLSVFLEWRTRPFTADPSWGYFMSNLGKLTPVTLGMIALGSFLAFWIPFRARRFF